MNTLIFKWRDELIQVNPDDIVYFQADGNYCTMMLASRKEQLLTMNMTRVQSVLEEQLGSQSALFERTGRDLIIRKATIFSIQVLRQKLILAVPNSEKYFELHVSKDALKKLKASQEIKAIKVSTVARLRDLQTRKIYPLNAGTNRFGRKSTVNDIEQSIDNGDNQISRQHFTVEVLFDSETRRYQYYLTDKQSANGTYLNNERIQKDSSILIHFGNKIRVGKTELVLENTDIDRTEIV